MPLFPSYTRTHTHRQPVQIWIWIICPSCSAHAIIYFSGERLYVHDINLPCIAWVATVPRHHHFGCLAAVRPYLYTTAPRNCIYGYNFHVHNVLREQWDKWICLEAMTGSDIHSHAEDAQKKRLFRCSSGLHHSTNPFELHRANDSY